MELFQLALMCTCKTTELKIFAKKALRKFDTGIVEKLRKFHQWAKNTFNKKNFILLKFTLAKNNASWDSIMHTLRN